MPRLDITITAINKARKDARPGQPAYDIIDSRAPGLLLRVGPRGLRWAWKVEFNHKTRRMDLGAVDDWTIDEARTIADEATRLIRERRGIVDVAWLAEQRARFGKAPEPTSRVELPRPFKPEEIKPWKPVAELFAWTYREAVERYVASVTETHRKATAADYRKTLNHPDLKELQRFPVSTITVDRVQRLVDAIAKSGRHTTAVGMTVKIKAFWKWLARPAIREQSMVKADAMVLLEKPRKPRRVAGDAPRAKKHFPLLPEVGLLVALARSGALDARYSVAILLVAATAQRNHAVVSAARGDFMPCDEEPGWGVWRVQAIHRKGASEDDEEEERTHAIPLTPALWKVVKAHRDAGEGEWMFPGFRPRRKGMAISHMSESALTHLFDALPGVTASPHDLRRALRTQARKALKVKPLELSLILDHAEGRAGNVTEEHYADDELLDIKRPVVERWWDLIERHATAAAESLPPVEEIQAHIAREQERQKGRSEGTKAA